MARDNVEVLRRHADAWRRGDLAAAMEVFHPDVVWRGVKHGFWPWQRPPI